MSKLHDEVQDLAVWLAVWENRKEPDALARRSAADAIDSIDAALKNLYLIRGRLTHEVRQADDELLG